MLIISISLFVFFCAFSFLVFDLLQYAETPVNSNETDRIVVIKPGQGFTATLNSLKDTGVIKNPIRFEMIARIKGYDKKIKAGEYLLSSSMPPIKILETIVKGKVRLYKVTVPEGYNIRQTASIMNMANLATKTDFLKAATDALLVRENGIDAETFEGYLFPDTYCFPKNITSKGIITTMVEQFRAIFTPEWKNQAKKLNLTIHQVVTLASIIEKETGAQIERPIISSVFHNRLRKKMRLESDPTVIYGIKNFDGNITRKHLSKPTSYNTYKIRGLPPGPIANPGLKAIEAALFPEKTNFLYFVSKGDGTHKFSTNIADHNRAVRKYQLRKQLINDISSR
ncbi:MAG: endolytic transglycosylase MltG [Deltaproteobacteria bacterium]|nr:endolytic transglycosylase MltG [Deltaproteobacteria bacterium]MBW2661763.1 endolytic transglycosylase MltG [Deltaproteobacteria bacterium]